MSGGQAWQTLNMDLQTHVTLAKEFLALGMSRGPVGRANGSSPRERDTDLHMQEVGLQNLHEKLLSHSLCQGLGNHLGTKDMS